MCVLKVRLIMISRTDRINNANSSSNHYKTQKSEGRGQKNLFVGGSANDVVNNDTDEAVILTGAGNDTITSSGTKDRIESNGGNNIITVSGNENTVKAFNGNNTIVSKGDSNAVVTNNGNNSILAVGSNNNIQAGTGNDAILALGNYNNIDAGDGNNSVVFEGDNININAGNGNNYIASLDFAIAGGNYADFASYLDGKSSTATTKNMLLSSTNTTKQIGQNSTTSQTVTTVGRTQTTTTTTTTNTTTQDYTVNTYADQLKTTLNGNKNVTVNTKDGNNNILVNGNNSNITTGKGNNNITAVDGIVVNVGYTNQRTEEVAINGSQKTTSTSTSTSTSRTIDPLIIDFNQDGVVSAERGKGADLDGDGIADGAATGGDKMLAISDINGNGKIDGQEVFGDKTVDPFTGEALNATNGFEALKLMAESAQAHTGVKCIDGNGLVDLKALNQALQTVGVKLGFISDNNTSEIEDLTKVAYINTKDYATTQESGSIQHNQQGTSIFEDGSTAKAEDVWFELSSPNNPFDITKLKEILNK